MRRANFPKNEFWNKVFQYFDEVYSSEMWDDYTEIRGSYCGDSRVYRFYKDGSVYRYYKNRSVTEK